jgi:hypothetical protein
MLWKAGGSTTLLPVDRARVALKALSRVSRDIHRLLPRPPQTPWKCGQFAVRKMRAFHLRQPLSGRGSRVRLFLHRARSASRPKQLAGAVGGSRRFPGDVDESATGSVNFFWSGTLLEHGIFGVQSKNGEFVLHSEKSSQIARFSVWHPLRVGEAPSKFPLAPSTERE